MTVKVQRKPAGQIFSAEYTNTRKNTDIGWRQTELLHCLAAKCIVIGPVCGFACLSVCCVCLWVCYHDNSKLHASFLTKLGLLVKVVTISSWLNFGRPAPPGRGSAAGRNFWLRFFTTASAQCLCLLRALFSLYKPRINFETQPIGCCFSYFVQCGIITRKLFDVIGRYQSTPFIHRLTVVKTILKRNIRNCIRLTAEKSQLNAIFCIWHRI